ncbi:MAG TPA: HIT domain-containing protein [Polyangia bacterium]|nr:HIT domain-containing protein [Polyangia bacterium]
MTETLWAPWRMEFIRSEKEPGCVFCKAQAAPEAERAARLVLARREHAFVIMNRYPYTHGHIMVVPRRHVSRLDDLDAAEQAGLFGLTVDAQVALRVALSPQGLNLGMNLGRAAGAGIEDHIHIHLVPRWVGDTNFMPLLADVRVMPENLAATWEGLRPRFAALEDRG